jgi:hypothetical protein
VATSFGGIAGMLGGTAVAMGIQGQLIAQQYYYLGGMTQMAYSPAAQANWVNWNTQWVQTIGNVTTVWQSWNAITSPTAQEFFQQPAPSEAQIEEYRTQAARIEQAKLRAEEFLLENLSPAQRETYTKHKMFIVETPRKRRYALYHAEPVHRLEGEKRVERYCIHTYGVPKEDELLGFKLLLEANEDEFLKTANATRLAA